MSAGGGGWGGGACEVSLLGPRAAGGEGRSLTGSLGVAGVGRCVRRRGGVGGAPARPPPAHVPRGPRRHPEAKPAGAGGGREGGGKGEPREHFRVTAPARSPPPPRRCRATAAPMAGPPRPAGGLWEQICNEYEAEQPPFPEGYKVREATVTSAIPLESTILSHFNLQHFYPVSLDYSAIQNVPPPPLPEVPEVIDPKTCSPKDYLETYIFPVLLPGLVELLHQAKKEKCFERRRTKFIACDFLTEWLYNQNPKRTDESFTEFFSIPFVVDWLKDHPRPPVPLSLLLSEEGAALIIQSFWRGYRIRCDPEVQELRQWQKQLRQEKHIRERVKEFWNKQEIKGNQHNSSFSTNSKTPQVAVKFR
uniref:IQ motif containing K n=2 Tax=Ornithorhynchus anatinus TaxID=9258 RepID=K7E7G5_ORNAN